MKCEHLKSVEISNGIEYIEKDCFKDSYNKSEIEEITFPSTLKEVDKDTFCYCHSLKTVWVEEGGTLNVNDYMGHHVVILPAGTMVGN